VSSLSLFLNVSGYSSAGFGTYRLERVLPTLKKALESDALNLISIVNTHQYVSLISGPCDECNGQIVTHDNPAITTMRGET